MNLKVQIGLKSQIEALLLLGGEDIKLKELSKFFNISQGKLVEILLELKEERKGTGINIEIDGENIYLVTNPLCGEIVNSFFNQETKPKKLSPAALETLSIIAYHQPITKSEIEAIRGVSVDRIIQNIEEKKFIRNCGKKESIGRPNLYEVTDKFLGYLGINSVEELPDYAKIKEKINGRNEN
ncbi:segregation and condensation protein B [Cetobacterium ceti]|uniref:Segregation and condensation protein B n=1 Tax=Cetobacterium ceti TaxID=180163 RepID=A0A1T4KLD9_9FUSO|nr:segregation and condensation protein B [Cetobacterium ceti]